MHNHSTTCCGWLNYSFVRRRRRRQLHSHRQYHHRRRRCYPAKISYMLKENGRIISLWYSHISKSSLGAVFAFAPIQCVRQWFVYYYVIFCSSPLRSVLRRLSLSLTHTCDLLPFLYVFLPFLKLFCFHAHLFTLLSVQHQQHMEWFQMRAKAYYMAAIQIRYCLFFSILWYIRAPENKARKKFLENITATSIIIKFYILIWYHAQVA